MNYIVNWSLPLPAARLIRVRGRTMEFTGMGGVEVESSGLGISKAMGKISMRSQAFRVFLGLENLISVYYVHWTLIIFNIFI